MRQMREREGGRMGMYLAKRRWGLFTSSWHAQKKKNSNNANNKKDRSEGKVHNSTNSGGGAGRIKKGMSRGEIHF